MNATQTTFNVAIWSSSPIYCDLMKKREKKCLLRQNQIHAYLRAQSTSTPHQIGLGSEKGIRYNCWWLHQHRCIVSTSIKQSINKDFKVVEWKQANVCRCLSSRQSAQTDCMGMLREKNTDQYYPSPELIHDSSSLPPSRKKGWSIALRVALKHDKNESKFLQLLYISLGIPSQSRYQVKSMR